jgi:hypothetical protein
MDVSGAVKAALAEAARRGRVGIELKGDGAVPATDTKVVGVDVVNCIAVGSADSSAGEGPWMMTPTASCA